jgi:hypothetical protein
MPIQLPPDFSKVDLPKLASDMQKWYSVMPSMAQEWWESFLQTLETTDNHPPANNTCPIFSLKNHIRRPSAEPEETAEIPAQLSDLREKELEPLEQVNKNNFKGVVYLSNTFEKHEPTTFTPYHTLKFYPVKC